MSKDCCVRNSNLMSRLFSSTTAQTTAEKQQPMDDLKNELLTALKAFVTENQNRLEQV